MAGDDRNDATWLQRLKAAYAAGYYRIEAADDVQMPTSVARASPPGMDVAENRP